MNRYEQEKIYHYDRHLGIVVSSMTHEYMQNLSPEDLDDILISTQSHADLAAKYRVPYKTICEIRGSYG